MMPYLYIVLPSYGVMAFLGFLAAVILLFFRLDKYEISFRKFIKLLLICATGCFIGSKMLYAVTRIPELVSDFSFMKLIMLVPSSGYVFYGGLFGVIFGIVFYSRKDKVLRKKLFDFAVPAFPLFHAFGRIGCMLAGCCYGIQLKNPIGIEGVIYFYRLPVPLIESVFEFVLFGVLLFIQHKAKEMDILKIYLISYSLFRFGNEFFRGDDIRGIWFGLSTSQWISIIIVCSCCFMIFKKNINTNVEYNL